MRRGFWFVAGAGAGVYVMIRARRAAEAFTPDGLRDRWAGANVGAQIFAAEVRAGMAERETDLRERLGLALDGAEALAVEGPAGQFAPIPPAPLTSDDSHSMEGTH